MGECDYGDVDYENGVLMPGGRGGPVAFGRGGEGPSDSAFDLIWAAMCLAAGGATLVGLATLARRRARQ